MAEDVRQALRPASHSGTVDPVIDMYTSSCIISDRTIGSVAQW